jgi:PiT family inorganic phosphate transporter
MLVLGAFLVFIFDFTNGFHDASNMVATMIASRAITPLRSVLVVGLFGFLGPLLGGTAVADTIGGVVVVDGLSEGAAFLVVLSGLGGAIVWNLLTFWKGLPSSSSHALVGSLVGAMWVSEGAQRVDWGLDALADGELTGVTKILVALLLSPILGFGLGWALQRVVRRLLARAHPRVNRWLRRGQWLTASALAFAHGTNDAQKGMGILTLLLVVAGSLGRFEVPTWVMLLSATGLLLGTLFGGWRIIATVGFGIYRLRPLHGLDAQLASAAIVLGAGEMGGPVSTTHVVTTSVMGVGAAERPRAVKWGRALDIGLTWIVTLPGAALLGLILASLGLALGGAAR